MEGVDNVIWLGRPFNMCKIIESGAELTTLQDLAVSTPVTGLIDPMTVLLTPQPELVILTFDYGDGKGTISI
jgi:hypothetical protein